MIGKTKDGIIFYSIRYEDEDGSTKQKYQQDKKWRTKKEAKEAMDAFLAGLNKHIPNQALTLDQLYKRYTEFKKDKIKPRSLGTYDKFYYGFIHEYFGGHKINKITPTSIHKWQTWLLDKGIKNNYSSNIQMFFKALLNFAIEFDMLERNPFRGSLIKNTLEYKKADYEIWTPEEFNQFIGYVEDDMYKALFMILYLCGLRKGEAIALTIKDINFNNSTINVSKTYDRTHNIVTTPKTKNSVRSVYMVEELKNQLLKLIELYKKYPEYDEDAILLGYNSHLSETTIKRVQEKACIESKVKIIRIHDLRHSHVSLLIDMGFNPHQIADRLGHTVDMVNNTYAHLFLDTQQKMADMLEARMKGITDPIKRTLN